MSIVREWCARCGSVEVHYHFVRSNGKRGKTCRGCVYAWHAEKPEKHAALQRRAAQRRRTRDPEGVRAIQRAKMRRWRAANPERARTIGRKSDQKRRGIKCQ